MHTGDFQSNSEPQSVAIMKSHIKELIAQLSKAEDDKEKIAKEAYNKAMEIKREADKRLEDAHACQMKQANLIERLKVGLNIYFIFILKKFISVQDKFNTSINSVT